MNNTYYREYQHLMFKKHWRLSENCLFALGQCDAIINTICHVPIDPKINSKLLKLSLNKGAQSTTAIEGNTLSYEEVEMVRKSEKLPPSKKYQEQEVKNILDAFTSLLKESVLKDRNDLLSEGLLLNFHKMVGKDLGENFEAIPGRFRERDVIVGKYRCPDYRDVEGLINEFCNWQREEFRFEEGKQGFKEAIIQAIVAHIYIEWIHPFGDGNGRTGRLVEFYILLRGGLPNIALHILSNHYNDTRPEYYKQIEKATEKRDLSELIEYAVIGLRDGLENTLRQIQEGMFDIAWKAYIYDAFSNIKGELRGDAFKRKRKLALNFPPFENASAAQVPKLNTELAFIYAPLNQKTLTRDLDELVEMEILLKESNLYKANIFALRPMMALTRKTNVIKSSDGTQG